MKQASTLRVAFAFLAAALVGAGCATPQKYEGHKTFYAQGLYKESVAPFEAEMAKRQKKAGVDENGENVPVPGSRSYALDDIEMGSGYRAAQQIDDSLAAFERAEQGIREQQEASLAGNALNQVAAVLANDNALPYQVQEYDGIMVNTYKALDLLQKGEIDAARVEFRRVEERQRMSAERFKELIAKERAAEGKKASAEDIDAASEDGEAAPEEEGGLKAKVKKLIVAKFDEAKKTVMGSLQDGENKAKLDEYEKTFAADTWGAQDAFTNPFATYMQGVFLLFWGEDRSDTESAVHALATACRNETDPAKNPAAKALELANQLADGKIKRKDLDDKVIVVFENGLGPERQEYQIPIIIPLNMELNSNAKFVDATIVLPKLVSRDEAFPYLSVCYEGAELAKTVSVCNMDAVVASEFRERMPMIVFRNVIQSGVKAVLQVLIVNELGKQGVPRIAASAVVSALFNLTKSADTRIWSSLPKNFQVAVVDRPGSGYLQIVVPGAPDPIGTARIPAGAPALVYVHTPAATVPATVTVVSTAKE